tara:strand:+ start:1503 stop:2231 length:729 start_codon:yes stop_codon:yes gene_type:complete
MTQLIQLSEIASFFGFDIPKSKNHVAIVGGGGKTTILHALGNQLHGKTILTCTTKMGFDQHGSHPIYFDPDDDTIRSITSGNPIMVWKEIQGERAIGVNPSACDRWFGMVDNVIIEADGSRKLPFKAPAEFEPVIPSSATAVISTIGADALDQVINNSCHRPQRVADLAECNPDQRLTPERAARVLLHPQGQRKAKPPHAKFCIAIAKVNDGNGGKAEILLDLIDSLEKEIRVAAIASTGAH